jgi:large subunit ribosomal protein L30
MGKIRITQVRSVIGRKPDHGRTIEALGLGRIRKAVIHNDTPQIRGMIKTVEHLVRVEEIG